MQKCLPLVAILAFACSSEPSGVQTVPVTPTAGTGGTTTATGGGGAGGASTAGTGGTSTAGTGGTGGAAAGAGGSGGMSIDPASLDPNLVYKAPGCGMQAPQGQQLATYTEFSVHVSGATLTDFKHPEHDRKYYVWLPPDYDPNKTYHIVYIMYGCGDPYAGATATYKLMNADPDAIYVGLNMPPTEVLGPSTEDYKCYNDDGGPSSTEWEFFGLVTAEVDSRYCVDKNRCSSLVSAPVRGWPTCLAATSRASIRRASSGRTSACAAK